MTKQDKTPLIDAITALEKQVWEALVSGDATADAALLSNDFLGVYPDGFAAKADHFGQLAQGATVESYTLGQTKLRQLGPDHALLSYRATFRRVGKELDETMYVSSIWQCIGKSWINIFSQDTPEQM